eukprot:3228021-Alexandrium_andersonii.AAC.1
MGNSGCAGLGMTVNLAASVLALMGEVRLMSATSHFIHDGSERDAGADDDDANASTSHTESIAHGTPKLWTHEHPAS